MATSSPSITTTKNAAVMKMVPTIAGVTMLSSRLLGGSRIRPGRGGSLHRAMEAKVSMMTLIQSSCSTVNGAST